MGKRIRYMFCIMLVLVLAWIIASLIDVNVHNMADQDFQKWNAFSLFAKWHGAAGESSGTVSTVATCKSDADIHVPEETPELMRMLVEKRIASKKASGKKCASEKDIP